MMTMEPQQQLVEMMAMRQMEERSRVVAGRRGRAERKMMAAQLAATEAAHNFAHTTVWQQPGSRYAPPGPAYKLQRQRSHSSSDIGAEPAAPMMLSSSLSSSSASALLARMITTTPHSQHQPPQQPQQLGAVGEAGARSHSRSHSLPLLPRNRTSASRNHMTP